MVHVVTGVDDHVIERRYGQLHLISPLAVHSVAHLGTAGTSGILILGGDTFMCGNCFQVSQAWQK
jgi:hypothetical protein